MNKGRIIVFDWDDTLFPTAFIYINNYSTENMSIHSLPPDIAKHMNALDVLASILLGRALEFGTVLIITNAHEKWVMDCAHAFLPKVAMLLQTRIKVVSARSDNEASGVQMMFWKQLSFSKETKGYKEVISIGDSVYERIAALSMSKVSSGAVISKSVKLIENPRNIIDLISQLFYVSTKFDEIVKFEGNLDLQTTFNDEKRVWI